jgi:hypothetical protein
MHYLVVSVTRRRRERACSRHLVRPPAGGLRRVLADHDRRPGRDRHRGTGRLIWQAFAANLGVVAVPVVSARTFVVAALGTLILAKVLAAGPALVAARARPVSLFRIE